MINYREHLQKRLAQLNDRCRDQWPQWTNADYVAVSALLHTEEKSPNKGQLGYHDVEEFYRDDEDDDVTPRAGKALEGFIPSRITKEGRRLSPSLHPCNTNTVMSQK